jgi:hypothetical protein
MQNLILKDKNLSNNLPTVKKLLFGPRNEFSMGMIESQIKKDGGTILRLWANYKNWHVIARF